MLIVKLKTTIPTLPELSPIQSEKEFFERYTQRSIFKRKRQKNVTDVAEIKRLTMILKEYSIRVKQQKK